MSAQNLNFDITLLKQKQGVGSISNTTCKIENAVKTVDVGINREIVEVFISNVSKLFTAGEKLVITGTYPNTTPFIFSEKIIGSISNLTINPKNQGLKYVGVQYAPDGSILYPGDPVVFYGGLSTEPEARKAVAYVNNVTTGQIKSVQIIKGGFGFTSYPNTSIDVISASGTGANLVVKAITNPQTIHVNTDTVGFKKDITLGSFNYQFIQAYPETNVFISTTGTTGAYVNLGSTANSTSGHYTNTTLTIVAGAGINQVREIISYAGATRIATLNASMSTPLNSSSKYRIGVFANTELANALFYSDFTIGSIESIDVINGGSGFRLSPSANNPYATGDKYDPANHYSITPTYDTDLSIGLVGEDYANNVQHLNYLGAIANVTVRTPGSGYSNVTDSIYPVTHVGYGASFDFVTNLSGAITEVIVQSGGEGYNAPIYNMPLVVANSTDPSLTAAGSGAVLIPYGYGEGEDFVTSVSDIGRIIDFRITSRGFDYISTPNVSLRVLDINVSTQFSATDALTILDDQIIYQGTNPSTTTFKAYIDKYNSTLSNTVPSFLRLYNYTGAIDIHSDLKIVRTSPLAEYNVTPNVVNPTNVFTVYGNGIAKANAQFLNGLINYDGFYLNTDGQPSSDQYLQNYTKYHNFSYVVQVEEALETFRNVLMKIAHPVGTQLLSETILMDTKRIVELYESEIPTIKPRTGSVSVDPFDPAAELIGTGTSFNSSANSGDYIVINNTSNTRQQIKTIINVTDNNHLTLESNTRLLGNGSITAYALSNTLTVNANIYDTVMENDMIEFILSDDTHYLATVLSTGPADESSTLVIDTLSTDIVANSSNVVYYIYPTLDDVNYQIINN